MHLFIRSPLSIASLIGLECLATPAIAVDYGVYDARALAMGGATVAVGDTSQGAYYNPALLSFHEGDEDESRDGRTYFPTIVAQASNTVDSALKAAKDNLDKQLSDSVSKYNTQQNTNNAALVAHKSRDLRSVLDKIANKDLTLDGFAGLSVSEPSNHEGGAFYVGARVIGAGTSKVSDADLALLNEYISALDQIAQGAAPSTVAAQHPKLINNAGELIDPTSSLSSSADIGGLAIGEWGLALAKEFTLWNQRVSFGVTPKMMRVDAYRDTSTFKNSRSTNSIDQTLNQFSNTKSTHNTFNADFGVASIIAEHYRVSLAIKDAFAKDFTTHQDGITPPDLRVKLHPRSRLGLGYVNEQFSLGVDYDLTESTPIANEAKSQHLCLGAEYRVWGGLALRLGYKKDQTGMQSNMISGGIGYQWRRFVTELAYAQSSDMKGAGLQMGWTF